MEKPYVICHVLSTIDGKSTGRWLESPEVGKLVDKYFEMQEIFGGNAFGICKTTMEDFFTLKEKPEGIEEEAENAELEDFVSPAKEGKTKFLVSFDRLGSLYFEKNEMECPEYPWYNGCHIIQVVSPGVNPSYLNYLKNLGISYIIGERGQKAVVLAKLKEYFGIFKILIEGGPGINEAFLKEDLIDEISIVQCPLTGSPSDKSIFLGGDTQNFKIAKVDVSPEDNYVWLNFKKNFD